MSETYTTELFRQEGDQFRAVDLTVNAGGSVKLYAQDMGVDVKEIWGDDEYEFWVDVPARELHKLVFALLREKYSGRSQAVTEFKEFCGKEEIKHEFQSWT